MYNVYLEGNRTENAKILKGNWFLNDCYGHTVLRVYITTDLFLKYAFNLPDSRQKNIAII